MNLHFYYEIRRDTSLREQEKSIIKTILQGYTIDQEQRPTWKGESCALPVFRCFEVPLLYAEQIGLGEEADGTACMQEVAHWCSMLDILRKGLPDILIIANVNGDEIVYDVMNGYVPTAQHQESFLELKQQEKVDIPLPQEEAQRCETTEDKQATTSDTSPTDMTDTQETTSSQPKESTQESKAMPPNDTQEEPRRVLETSLYLKKNKTDGMDALVPSLEEELHISLPGTYRDFLLRYNGGEAVDTYFHLNAVNKFNMAEGREVTYHIERFYGFYENSFSEHTKSITFTSLLEKGYFSFAEDAFGNRFILTLQGKQYGEVSFYCHDDSPHITLLAKDFTEFMRNCHSEIGMFDNEGLQRIEISPMQDEGRKDMAPVSELARFFEEETSNEKAVILQQLMQETEPVEEGYLHFDSFPFKLAILQQLMYEQELLPKYDLYEELDAREIDWEDDFRYHGPLLLAVRYFKSLRIPTELAAHIVSLDIDGGDEIYGNIDLEWGGESGYFDIGQISDAEFAQFPALKQVSGSYLSPIAIQNLREHGILVSTIYDDQDYSTNHCYRLLQHPESCAVLPFSATATALLAKLREVFGAYYQELFRIGLKDWETHSGQQILAKDGRYAAASILQSFQLSLILFESGSEEDCYLVTKDIATFQKAIGGLNVPFQLERLKDLWILREGVASSTTYQGNQDFYRVAAKEAPTTAQAQTTSKQKMAKEKKRAFIFIAIVIGIAIFAIVLNLIMGSKKSYVYDENLNYDYKIVCYGNDNGCQLQHTNGELYVEEKYNNIIATYSSLLILNGDENDHSRIYDVKNKEYIGGGYLRASSVKLSEKGKPMEYEGVLATKDDRTYYLYSVKHIDGVKVATEPDEFLSIGDIYDVDTGKHTENTDY